MKNIFGILLFTASLTFATYYFIFNIVYGSIDEVTESYEVLLNKQIISNGDTLTITDYSMLYGNVSFDNGTTMSVNLARNRLLEEIK